MRETLTIMRNEWLCFRHSDRSLFLVYSILVISWGWLLIPSLSSNGATGGMLWLIFFSAIVTSNFSNTSFVAERMAGSLEILLTAGFSRRSILFGKIGFIWIMGTLLGTLCIGVAIAISIFGKTANTPPVDSISIVAVQIIEEIALYSVACFMNTSCTAWISFKVMSPRILPFVNILILGVIVVLHTVISRVYPLSLETMALGIAILGLFFLNRSIKAFSNEAVIQPMVF